MLEPWRDTRELRDVTWLTINMRVRACTAHASGQHTHTRYVKVARVYTCLNRASEPYVIAVCSISDDATDTLEKKGRG